MKMKTLNGIDLSLEAYVADAVKLLRATEPKDGTAFYGCFSGGKDSCVIKEVARLAGVRVYWHYNVTTLDPPELTRFIRREHPDVVWERPECNFFTYAVRYNKGFPTRKCRWCCEHFKERKNPRGARLILGVRAAESPRRKKSWTQVSYHEKTQTTAICPILGWSGEMVWEFIKSRNLPYCELYDQGFDRLGCIGCPMATKRITQMEFDRWPGYERKWKELFKYIFERRSGTLQRDGRIWFGDRYFSSSEEMFDWWLSRKGLPKVECQGLIELFV